MRGLAGRGVLVSGGSSGIGLAAARRFLEEGCRVFLCGLDAAEVDQALSGLAGHGQVSGLSCDVSREADVARLGNAAEMALGPRRSAGIWRSAAPGWSSTCPP